MKVEIQLDKTKEFIPFNLVIRIQTIGELMNMYQRFSNDTISDIATSVDKEVEMGDMNCYRIWDLLLERLKLEGVKK